MHVISLTFTFRPDRDSLFLFFHFSLKYFEFVTASSDSLESYFHVAKYLLSGIIHVVQGAE